MSETAFQNNLENLFKKTSEKAWDHFLKVGLPSRKMETFGYIKLRPLFAQEFIPSKPTLVQNFDLLPACKNSVLVFVNGHFQPHLSNTEAIPKRVVFLPLEEAKSAYGAFLNNQWARILKEENDPFALMNGALHQDGCFIYIPPGTCIENPIQILYITDSNEQMLIQPRIHLFAGANSEADFITTHQQLSGKNFFINSVTECVLEDNSKIQFFQNSDVNESWLFDAFRAILKKNSVLKTINITQGSTTVRNDYKVSLIGENGEVHLKGLWTLNERNEAHTNVLVDHQAPHCRSLQLFKGVLNGLSRSSFEGKIYVHDQAQKTDAFQLNNNLLLSDQAHADSKPNLEIFADDVKASHGATVGQLDQEELFYLKARGINEESAQKLLIQGFCKEVLDLIPSEYQC